MFAPKILIPMHMNAACNHKLLIKENLSIKDKCFGFVLVPRCPLFRGSTVYIQQQLERSSKG